PALVQASADAAIGALRALGVGTVHIGIFDKYSIFRERRLPLAHAEAALQGPYAFPNVLHRWGIRESVFDGATTFLAEPADVDPTSGRIFPFETDAALYVADYVGPSAARSPRRLLGRQIAKAAAMGFGVKAAFECEFTVLAETAETLRAKGFERVQAFQPDNRCYASDSGAARRPAAHLHRLQARRMGPVQRHRLGLGRAALSRLSALRSPP
ncbi:MAG: hypothetical protein ACREER_00645, partial [Alphaproteobacteria bacterium]